MRILLVYCNAMLENALPISVSVLSACLKQAGHEVALFDTTFYRWGPRSAMESRIAALQFRPCPLPYRDGEVTADFTRQVAAFQPQVLGFAVVEPTLGLAAQLLAAVADAVRTNGITVVFGGVHCLLAPETVARLAPVDYIAVSEAETTFVALCGELAAGRHPERPAGFWSRRGAEWAQGEFPPLTDLDSLPALDFDLFEPSYLNKPMMGTTYRTVSIELSRGCPYRCSYCGDHALAQRFAEQGRWYRRKALARVEQELAIYAKRYRPEFLYMISDSFLAQPLRQIAAFAEMYAPFAWPFWFNTRPENVTAEGVALLRRLNCARVSIGIEHGNENFRREVLNRGTTTAQIRRAAELLHAAHIPFSVNVIIGFPGETRALVFDSIALCRAVRADGVSVHIFNPYHGVPLREVCVQRGYIAADHLADDFFLGYNLRGNTLTADEVQGLFRTFSLYVRFDESRWPEIRRAEALTAEGDRCFAAWREEFYAVSGWSG